MKLILDRVIRNVEPIRGATYTCLQRNDGDIGACFDCEFIYMGYGKFVLTKESEYNSRKKGCNECCISWPDSLGGFPIGRISEGGDEITGNPMVIGEL